MNSFFDHRKFEAMKSLSGWEAAHCDEHQFRAKIKGEYLSHFELSTFDKWSEQTKKEARIHFCYRTPLCLAVFCVVFGQLFESC